jgi:hypothetical protein
MWDEKSAFITLKSSSNGVNASARVWFHKLRLKIKKGL